MKPGKLSSRSGRALAFLWHVLGELATSGAWPWAGLLSFAFVVGLLIRSGLALQAQPAVEPAPPAETTADTRQQPAPRLVPSTPPPGAKRPPCIPVTEVRLNGACWMPHAATPPCPPGLFEHGERCYAKVAEVPRVPTSVEE